MGAKQQHSLTLHLEEHILQLLRRFYLFSYLKQAKKNMVCLPSQATHRGVFNLPNELLGIAKLGISNSSALITNHFRHYTRPILNLCTAHLLRPRLYTATAAAKRNWYKDDMTDAILILETTITEMISGRSAGFMDTAPEIKETRRWQHSGSTFLTTTSLNYSANLLEENTNS